MDDNTFGNLQKEKMLRNKTMMVKKLCLNGKFNKNSRNLPANNPNTMRTCRDQFKNLKTKRSLQPGISSSNSKKQNVLNLNMKGT